MPVSPEQAAAILQGMQAPPSQPEPGFLRRAANAVGEFVTGNNQFEFPEVRQRLEREGPGALVRFNAARDINGKVDILGEIFPPGTVRRGQDENGNIFVTIGGEPFYINASGASGQDIFDVGLGFVEGVPAVAGGALGALVGNVPGAIAGAGAGAAAGSVLRDMGASLAGSSQGIDETQAAISALGGAAGESLSQVIGAGSRFLSSRAAANASDDVAREQARRVLGGSIGRDTEALRADAARNLNVQLRQGVKDPQAARRLAESRTLPIDVPITSGQATRDPRALLLEDAARAGNLTPQATTAVQNLDEAQNAALMANTRLMQQQFGNRLTAIEEGGQGARRVADVLQDVARSRKQDIDRAYRAFREAARLPSGPKITSQAGAEIGKRLRQSVGDFPIEAPRLGDAKALLSGFDNVFQVPGNARVTAVSLSRIENWRSQASKITRSRDPQVRAAAGRIVRAYDDALDDVFHEAMAQGDEELLGMLKRARTLRRRYADDFEAGDVATRLVSGDIGPDDAVKEILGAGSLGKGKGLQPRLERLRGLLGQNSPEWRAIKEEALIRMFRQSTHVLEGGAETFSGDKFMSALRVLRNEAPEAMRALFSADERALLGQFARVAQGATGRLQTMRTNPSRPGLVLDNLLRQFGPLGNNISFVLRDVTRRVGQAVSTGRIERAVQGQIPGRLPAPPGLGGFGGSVLANQFGE